VEAMRRGATDYVFKDRMQRLVPVVERAIAESEQRLARRRAECELDSTRERFEAVLHRPSTSSRLSSLLMSCEDSTKLRPSSGARFFQELQVFAVLISRYGGQAGSPILPKSAHPVISR